MTSNADCQCRDYMPAPHHLMSCRYYYSGCICPNSTVGGHLFECPFAPPLSALKDAR